MSFTNVQVDLGSLPEFSTVELQELNPSYARVVFGLALVFLLPVFIFVTVLLFAILVPIAGMPLLAAVVIWCPVSLLLLFLGFFAYKSPRMIRYGLRQHDVIVQSGIFWKKETVQPIRRIQHVEQHQGPLDKRFGLYELKLFSAGTGHFTFRIPGLDAEPASRIRQFILDVQQDGWGEDSAVTASEPTDLDTAATEAGPAETATPEARLLQADASAAAGLAMSSVAPSGAAGPELAGADAASAARRGRNG
jgi:membrane protein YdbS with pleckstrin-like domain